MRRIANAFALLIGLTIGGTTAWAQVDTIDPGADPAPPAPAPAPAPQPDPVIVTVPVSPDGTPIQTPEGEDGFYYGDGLDEDRRRYFGDGQGGNTNFGPVPPVHVVRRGDTLWDICWFYFNNPWEWPKVWSYNANITNPHWIYPGDLVRLYPQGDEPVVDDPDNPIDPDDPNSPSLPPPPVTRSSVSLRKVTFADQDKLKIAATIAGAPEDKSMLSFGDRVYLDYPKGKPPKVGRTYTIYTEGTAVKHPDDGRVIGSYVKIIGALKVRSVKKGKRAIAVITDSVDVIERGAKVGPLKRTFRTVKPRRNEVNVQGTVVALIGTDQLIGLDQIVFIDLGTKAKVKPGNRLQVIRRGDALSDITSTDYDIGLDDRRFPDRSLGEIMIVEAEKSVSVAIVTLAIQEIGVGDRVIMSKSKSKSKSKSN